MNDETHDGPEAATPWTSHAAKMLGTSESVVLVLIGVALVLVAVLLLYSAMHDLNEAVHLGPVEIERQVDRDPEHGAAGHDDHGDRLYGGDLARVAYAQRRALPDHRHDRRHPAHAGDHGDLADRKRTPTSSTTRW